mgnify:CR=1 FL=1
MSKEMSYRDIEGCCAYNCMPCASTIHLMLDMRSWITGHSYIVYGPLVNGATTFMFESTPLYPDAGRYWYVPQFQGCSPCLMMLSRDMVQRHRFTQFYTAPTAIRARKHPCTRSRRHLSTCSLSRCRVRFSFASVVCRVVSCCPQL